MSLNDREIEILSTIIEDYIATATPVGSRLVSRHSALGLSPASIRNVMADLTDKGYLEQPHTSAGRAPTPKAFRFYLSRVLKLAPLPENERRFILSELGETGPEISDTLRRAGQVLSAMSRQVSMVLAPLHTDMRLKRVEFALIKPTLVLVVLILQGGIIQKRLIELAEPVSADELTRFANYLNERFADKGVSHIRTEILAELKLARNALSDHFRRGLLLVKETFDAEETPQLFVEGAANVLSQPEFANLQSIRELIGVLEDRSRLLALLDKVMDSRGVLVTLGDESSLSSLPECGLIASPYTVMGRTIGVIGLIGPMRMDYANLMPVVDYTAQTLARILQDRF